MYVCKHRDQGSSLRRNGTGDGKSETFFSSQMNAVMLLGRTCYRRASLLRRASPLLEQPAFSPDLVLFIVFTGL